MKLLNRFILAIGLAFAAVADIFRSRSLATNAVFTPQETSRGTVSLDATAAIRSGSHCGSLSGRSNI